MRRSTTEVSLESVVLGSFDSFLDAQAIILVYDITHKGSFLGVEKWLKDVKDKSERGSFIYLVGNKSDLADQAQVSSEDVRFFAEVITTVFGHF